MLPEEAWKVTVQSLSLEGFYIHVVSICMIWYDRRV